MKKIFIFIPIILIVIGIPLIFFFLNKERVKDNKVENNNPEGTSTVEAGDGILTGGGSFSYIAESARGWEAYLAEKGASATYQFDSSKTGDFILWVKLTDDGLYTPGTRSSTIVVNGNRTLAYNHTPEDTKGWKWYQIGEVTLNEGNNTIVFTKNEDTAGAYVMDEFKFIPK